ncbi:uracil permease [Mycolicibacterium parafortuitum]|uniref:Uracil permease n=1 Tax=Mycolicibacterium parafortuitum TaxID=39692 RepID=A0A7I7U169_MYCPF|nr:solute carrier family 23 protein [Mycolicibacterium parafortuitum]BBY74663.1 uracil permease [Mycolicibacterium parafortuitum]
MSEFTADREAVLDVGIQDRLPLPKTGLFGLQHLLALTGIWIFPVLIGATLELSQEDVSHIVQACFLLTGLVTILQSSRIVRLPIVQGPTAAFFVAILAAAASYDLGTAFGSMVVAGLIFMALSIPIGNLGLFGHLRRFAADPIVFGTLFVIIGAQLANIGLPGWFGTAGTESYGWSSFWVGAVVVVVILGCMIFGGSTMFKRAAILVGIAVGSIVALLAGIWSPPSLGEASVIGVPTMFPFGFGVAWPVVILMLLAFFQAGAEAMGMYTLVSGWGGEKLSVNRINRGLFTEFLGSTVGAAFGGIGTTSYPENVGIIRITRIGSRFVTMAAGIFAFALAFLPQISMFIAGLSGVVLSAASTILFGIIAISGIQMLQKVHWDDLNIAVAATSFIVSLGTQWIPEDILAALPPQVAGLINTPMMLGVIMLITLNILVNFIIRPRLASRVAVAADA